MRLVFIITMYILAVLGFLNNFITFSTTTGQINNLYQTILLSTIPIVIYLYLKNYFKLHYGYLIGLIFIGLFPIIDSGSRLYHNFLR